MEDTGPDTAQLAPDAELHLATVVKCDIADSTQIWGALDPSDGLALMRAFRQSVEEVVNRHGGYIERWEGDGALILFGYPKVWEDAPETAVRAGLALVQAVRSVQLAGVRLEFRVGIASGLIAVDLINKSLDGLAINVAERLRAVAEPGWVVIADSTKRLTKSFFDYDDLGTRPAKGFSEGLRAWRAVRETPIVSRFEAQRFDTSRGEIFGRGAELAKLADSWSKSRAGTGQVVLLLGDAGMGKSRLARAVLDWASHDGATRLDIDCTPSTGNSPLFPVGVLLRRIARIGEGTSEAEKSDLAKRLLARFFGATEASDALNYLAPLFGLQAVPIPSSDKPEQVQEQTLSTLVRMLRAFAAQGTLTLLCEDLHWADDTTAQVVQRIAEDIAGLPTLLIVTARSRSHTTLVVKKIESFYKEITLEPLPDADAADLVRSVAKGARLTPDLIQGIVSRCEGVPLILEEVTRGTFESTPRDDPISSYSASSGPVPAPLQLVVESRLERWQEHKFMVQAASVLGREFSIGHLQRMVPDQTAGAVAAINLLADYGLFANRAANSSDRARFTHAMIRDAVYQTLFRHDRRRLHSRAADTLSLGSQGIPEATPEVLAHHLREAARFGESIRIRLAASGDTVRRGAYVEAEGHCTAALEDVDKVDNADEGRKFQFSLLVQQAVARIGRYGYAAPEVEESYRRAQLLFDAATAPEMRYPVIRGLATLNLVRGNLAAAHDFSLEGLQLAEQSKRPEFRIDAMSVHCYTTLYYGRLEDCRSWIDRCLKLYGEEKGENLTYPVPQDAATAAWALLPTVAWLLGDARAAEDAIEQGLQHVNRLGRDFDKALLYAWIAGTRFTQRRYLEAVKYAQEAISISHEHGFVEWRATGVMMARLAQAALQASPEAVAQVAEICTAFQSRGVGLNAPYYLWGLSRGMVNANQIDAARHTLRVAFGLAKESQESRMNAELLILQAEPELEPDVGTAIGLLSQALEAAQKQGDVATSLRVAATMVLRCGGDALDLERARAALDLLDGREKPDPAQPRWMHEHLADAMRVATALIRTAPGP